MSRNNLNRELVDWEQQLASIIERSDQNLHHLTSEFNRTKSSHPRPSSESHNNAMKHIKSTNRRVEGTYEKAAHDAFNTAVTMNHQKVQPHTSEGHPRIVLGLETERMLNDKLKSTSRAIDALRDQICIIADECKALNSHLARTERRVDVICHDVDSKGNAMNSIEAQLASDIDHLKREMITMLKNSELNCRKTISSSLRDSVHADIIEEMNDKLGALKTSLVNSSVPNAVKASFEKHALTQRKETVDLITKIVTITVQELSADLENSIATKVEQLRDEVAASATDANNHDLEELGRSVVSLRNDISHLKEETQPPIDSMSNKLTECEQRLIKLQASQGRNDADIMSAFDYLSQHKDLIKGMQQSILTKEDVQIIAEQIIDEKDNIFNKTDTDDFVDGQTLQSKLESIRQPMTDQFRELDSMSSLQNIETKVETLEDDFKRRLGVVLDVVESLEHRTQVLESSSVSTDMLFEIKDAFSASKSDISKLINDTAEQSTADVSRLRNDVTTIAERLNALEVQFSNTRDDNNVNSVDAPPVSSSDEDILARRLTELRTTLLDAKEQSQHELTNHPEERHSVVSFMEPVIKSPEALLSKPEDFMSPCVHLLGLGSPGSIATSDSLSITSPRRSPSANGVSSPLAARTETKMTESSLTDSSDPVDESCDANSPRSESPPIVVGSISTSDALSLCGDITVSNVSDTSLVNSGSEQIPPSSDLAAVPDANHGNTNRPPTPPTCTDAADTPRDDTSSILGSIGTWDEIECVSNSSPVKVHNPRHGVLAMNTVDNDVYDRWEHVLTELGGITEGAHL